MLKLVLFDLDGTLLPMDLDVYIKNYFGLLARKMEKRGYDPKEFVDSIWASVRAMVKNNGSKTNEKVFWETMTNIYGENILSEEGYLEEFYKTDYQSVKSVCGFNEKAAETIKEIKKMGIKVALATNPVFPEIATISRACWAGLDTNDFELITTYENSSSCKPNLRYYEEIYEKLGVSPEEVLMVGNDTEEDMIAEKTGAKVFLLTDCLINKENEDISRFTQGSFSELMEFIKSLA
jgi:FMN phosphatase YigB (HAD superfamily)